MSRQIGSDLLGILRGAQIVISECMKTQESQAKHIWKNSSIKDALDQGAKQFPDVVKSMGDKNVGNAVNEILNRASMVTQGIKAIAFSMKGVPSDSEPVEKNYLIYENIVLKPDDIEKMLADSYPHSESSDLYKVPLSDQQESSTDSSNTINETSVKVSAPPYHSTVESAENVGYSSENTVSSTPYSYKDTSHEEKVYKTAGANVFNSKLPSSIPPNSTHSSRPPVVLKTVKFKQKLSETAKERKVPSSRLSRVISFGSLAAGLGIGTVAEVTRRSLGLNQSVGTTLDSAFLTPANAERIVNTLCKVRGAALKIGQILSIQDSNVINPVLQQAFERVRQSADFMPRYQIEGVLRSELGDDWAKHFKEFDMKPFAAASIGQVHRGQLTDGRLVAVKIQYPGVAEGINSDIDNLISVLSLWNLFPEGMFIDKIVEVAKRELSWEVDYIREAECTKKFKQLLLPYPDFYIPEVIDHISTKNIFTSELIEGVPVDKSSEFDVETRKHVCKLIMDLCLKELFQFRYMQTDPNWSNFFYNKDSKKLILLDFGSSRPYNKEFIDQYIMVIKAAADGDRQKVLELSREMKFLTGFESKAMEEAHVDTVMILGEIFSEEAGEFDFGKQDTTLRVTKLVPTILTHRLCPPPEEIYSLHRKLSGVFLLCAKLNVKMNCRPLFMNVYNNYNMH